jgi:hypothetical protein
VAITDRLKSSAAGETGFKRRMVRPYCAVCRATGYGLEGRASIPSKSKRFFLSPRVLTGCGTHPAYYPVDFIHSIIKGYTALFVGPWHLLQFHNFFAQSVGILGRVISPSQGRYLLTGQHEYRINAHTNIHALSGIRTYNSSLQRAKTFHAFDSGVIVIGTIQWIPETFPPGAKWPECEADLSRPSSAKVKTIWVMLTLLMAWCLIN